MEFKLPDIGEGIHEAEIVKWLVREGQTVEEDQPIVEVMTDKATVEITSPAAGTVGKIAVPEGQTVTVGTVLVSIQEGRDAALPAPIPVTEAAPAPAAVRPASETPASQAPPRTMPATAVPRNGYGEGKVLATPATRRLAREMGVPLAMVQGSGRHGRVTKEDIRRYGVAPAPVQPAVAPAVTPSLVPVGDREERFPLRGMRKRIAEHMVEAKRHAPHFTYVEEVDMTELVAFRQQAKPLAEKRGVKLSYLPFFIKALVFSLKEFPALNATLDEEKNEIVFKKYYNIGIAAATPDGLIVPVIKSCETKNIFILAKEIAEMAEKARNNKLALSDLQGGTFTITNIGSIGGVLATPIVNYPQVAILGINKISPRPVVRDAQIVIRDIMYLSLSFDHRVIDGAVGAEFTKLLIQFLEEPKLLLLES